MQIKENLQIILFKINVTYTDNVTEPAAIVEGKLTLSCLSVCLSGCPHGTTLFPLGGFSGNLIFENSSKIYRGNSNFITA
jgi:hypothetical protein